MFLLESLEINIKCYISSLSDVQDIICCNTRFYNFKTTLTGTFIVTQPQTIRQNLKVYSKYIQIREPVEI